MAILESGLPPANPNFIQKIFPNKYEVHFQEFKVTLSLPCLGEGGFLQASDKPKPCPCRQ